MTIAVKSAWKALHQESADLKAEDQNLATEAKALIDRAKAENRSMMAEERKRSDDIFARLDAIGARQGEIQEDLDRDQRLKDRQLSAAVERHGGADPEDADETGRFRVYPQAKTGKGAFPTFGHQLQAIVAAAKGDGDARQLLVNNANRIVADAQGAGIAVDSDGGFLVQTDFASDIMRRMNEMGDVLSRVRRIPLTAPANAIKIPGVDETSRVAGSRWGGIRGYWVEEGEAPTATKPTFYRVALELHKVAALGYATEELLSHVAAMNAIFTEGFAEELLFLAEDAIIEGDGQGKPQGILTAAATVSVSKETGQAAATVVHGNLKKMWARLHRRSRSNAVWFINQDVEPALDDLAKTIGTGGVEPYYIRYGEDGVLRIKGRPVVAIEYCPTLGTVGDIILADLSQYALIDNGGVSQAQSMHVRFTTDEQAFRATYRVDGNLLWKSALTPFKGSNTQSPVITLATRA